MKKSVSIGAVFLVSFTSIILFCGLVLGALFVYQRIRLSTNNKDYQQCLNDQKEADRVALSYFPIFKQVSWNQQGNIFIKGVLKNPNVKALDATLRYSPGNCSWNKTIQYDSNSGDFTISIKSVSTEPNSNGFGSCSVQQFFLNIIPKDSSIICNGASKGASASPDVKNNCSLNSLIMYVDGNVTTSNGWCLQARSYIDLGLGSTPVWELSDTELKALNLSKINICNEGAGIDDRKYKCVNKSSMVKFFPF